MCCKKALSDNATLLKVLHAQLIIQLQSFPYDPKYIDLCRVNTYFSVLISF